MRNNEESIRFFSTWKSKPYHFMDAETAQRHARLTCTPRPAVVLTELKDLLGSIYDTSALDVVPRSKYNPEMLVAPCRKYEQGGHMGGIHWSAYRSAVRSVRSKFRRKEKVQPLQLEAVPYEGSKNSGLPFLAKKQDVYEVTLQRAKACMSGACPPPVVMFHRGKNVDVARPVFALPFEWHLVEGRFFYPLQECLLSFNNPYLVGRHSFEVGAKLNEIQYAAYVLEMDYSGFDGSLSGLLINSAFRILRQCLILDDADAQLWDRVVSYFITAPIVCPDGRVYYGRRHGVPSGSMFTQMIDTICNAIIIEYVATRLHLKLSQYVCVGDDSVVGLDSSVSISEITAMAKELGINVSETKTRLIDTSAGHYSPIHFLGHEWQPGLGTRRTEDTLERLLAPERVHKEFFSKDRDIRYRAYVERIRAYYEDNCDVDTCALLRRLEMLVRYPHFGRVGRDLGIIQWDRHVNEPTEVVEKERWNKNVRELRSLPEGRRLNLRVVNYFA